MRADRPPGAPPAGPLDRRPRRRGIRLAALAGAALLAGIALLGPVLAKPRALPMAPEAVSVTAAPIAAFRPSSDATRFGQLEFLGGIRLSSDFSGFGGLSGFALEEAGRFVAVSDAGVMFTGRLDLDGDRPLGLSEVRAAALRDGRGKPLRPQRRGDAEAVAIAPDAVYVAIEDVNEIWRYPRPPLGRGGTLLPVPAIKGLRDNLGIESLAYVGQGPLKGALLAVSEEGESAAADLPGFIIAADGSARSFTIAKSGPFNATDLVISADGWVYLLERHFSFSTGVLMQVRRFPLAAVVPGAHLAGTVLGTFDMGYEIDNMEAMAVTTAAGGRTVLTLVSDDNFSPMQRTILLRFAVIPD